MDRPTFTLYVLKSLRNGKRYIGSTGQPMQVRLGQHNRGVNKWARQNRPFELLYTEQFGTKAEVTARERFLKTVPAGWSSTGCWRRRQTL
jgi:predicted GIY-YIG superfamily endonuclease